MGLDKKLFPPRRRRTWCPHKHVCCWGHAVHCDPCDSCIERKLREDSASVIMPCHGASVESVEETLETVEESSEEETENQSSQESEDTSQTYTSNSDYEEDFEPHEEVNEEVQTGDQMNGMSDDKNHNLGYGKESETSSQKALQASDSEKDETDGYFDDRGSEDDQQERRPADSLSSMSAQCSTETDSHADTMTDNVNGKEDCNIKSTSDSAAHAHYGNENGEKKLLRKEENQETSALEKKGIDEAEKAKPEALTAREDTRVFHENIMAMQHHNPEVNGEFKQTELAETNMNEEEKCPPVPWESRVLNVEDDEEESPRCEEGGAPDGRFLAEGKRSPGVQEAAAQAVPEGLGTGQGQALEQDGAAEGEAGSGEAGGEAAWAGDSVPQAEDSVPQAGTGAALEESAPEEGAVAEEHPKGKGTGEAVELGTEEHPKGKGTGEAVELGTEEHPKGEGTGEAVKLGTEEHPKGEGTGEAVELGTEMSPEEHGVLEEGMERGVALGMPAAGGEGPAGALPGWEADRAVPRGQEGAGGNTEEEEEEAAEEGFRGAVRPPAEEEVGEAVSLGESLGQGGSAGKDVVLGAVSEGEEAVEDADVAADGIATAVGPEGAKAVEEDVSEGQGAMGKPGALWEALGDMETGEAMPGGERFVKPSEFSQLKASGEERMEMGKAVPGAAAPESAQAREVGGNALRRAEDTMEESVELRLTDKGPVLEAAPGLGTLGGARGDPVTEGSVRAEDTPAAQREDGAAEALWGGNPSEGSEAETERAVRGKAGQVLGGSAGAAGAGSAGEEEATERAAGSGEPAAGTEGWPGWGEVRGKGTCPGDGPGGEAAPGLCGTRAGEPGLVAIAVLGGEPGALNGERALARGPAPARGPALTGGPAAAGTGTGAVVAQEGVTGAVLGTQRGTGAVVAQEAVTGAVPGAQSGTGAVVAQEGMTGAVQLGEEPTAETPPSTPAHGDGRVEARGRGSAGGEGLCPGTRAQLAAPETGTERGRDGRQEQGTERAGVKAQGEEPSPCANTRDSEVPEVPEGAGCAAGAGEQRKDSPFGASPGVPAASEVGERSRSPRQEGANPDPLIMSSERPQDGEETLL